MNIGLPLVVQGGGKRWAAEAAAIAGRTREGVDNCRYALLSRPENDMIGKLKGIIDAIGENHCVIDVNGVGYEVQASSRTLRNLKPGEAASLAIDTHVREDAIRLFGFSTEVERAWFRTLMNVQGVGSKVALSALGTLAPQDMANAIALGDWASFERTPGIGKKLAERIVLELKDKAPAYAPVDASLSKLQAELDAPKPTAASDAVSALVNLGYGQSQAGAAVSTAMRKGGDDQPTERLIRLALKELALG